MTKTRHILTPTASALIALMTGAFVPAFGQEAPERIEVKGEIVVTPGLADGEGALDADARLAARTSTVLENGLELGVSGSVVVDGDEPANRYGGGRYSSLTNGGARGLGDDADLFVEGAFLFARGGFGSVSVGKDAGVASRLSVTSPTIFEAIGVNDWRTDLTGLNDVHTVNDFSGQAPKISYMPPHGFLGGLIGQVQLGLSYSPRLDECGTQRCAPVGGFVRREAEDLIAADQAWRDVVETAVYYQNGIKLGEERLRIGVSGSYVRAEDEAKSALGDALDPLLGDYSAYAFGLNLAYGNVKVGGSVKSSNQGLNPDRDEDYLAFDAGVTLEAGEWNFMLGYGAADAERDAALLVGPAIPRLDFEADRKTQTAQAGISYAFDQGVTLGAAAQFVDSDKDLELGGPEDAAALVFESSIKF